MTSQEHIDELFQASHLKLQDVHPHLSDCTYSIIKDLAMESGLYFAVFMGFRTPAQQEALFAQGRMPVFQVNQLRKAAGLSEISMLDNKVTVTKLKFGMHNLGLAVDLVEDGDEVKAGVQWSWAKTKDFLVIGKYAKRYGLEWGGFWSRFQDTPHLQLTSGLSQDTLFKIYRNGGIQHVWDAVSERLK